MSAKSVVLSVHHEIALGPMSELEEAEQAYFEARSVNLLEMRPLARQRAIEALAKVKVMLALAQPVVCAAIEQRAAELNAEVSPEERLAIARHFVPTAFIVQLR